MTEKRKKRESVGESSVKAMSSPPILPSDLIMQILLWYTVLTIHGSYTRSGGIYIASYTRFSI